jgi:hypothetical protein
LRNITDSLLPILSALPGEWRVHFQYMWNAESPGDHDTGDAERTITFVHYIVVLWSQNICQGLGNNVIGPDVSKGATYTFVTVDGKKINHLRLRQANSRNRKYVRLVFLVANYENIVA